MTRRGAFEFGFGVALPAILAVAATAAIVLFALSRIAFEVNAIIDRQAYRTVQSALADFSGRVGETVEDYAVWNDAVKGLYEPFDDIFFDDNLVSSTATGLVFDVAVLIDTTGQPVAGAIAGERILAGDPRLDGLAGLAAALPTDDGRQTGYGLLDDVVVATAGHAVLPQDDSAQTPNRPRTLVIGRFLTPERLSALGEVFSIDELALRPRDSPPEGYAMEIVTATGQPVASVVWKPERLGEIAYENVKRPVKAVLVLLAFVMLFLLLTIWKALAQSHADRDAATRSATLDALSGLPNRMAFNEAIARAVRCRQRLPVAVLFVDLDGFKDVNDTYGHEIGDRLIRAVSAGFHAIVGDDGLLSRLGGDEFAVLFHGDGAADRAAIVAPSLIQLLSEPFDFDGRIVQIGASIGLAIETVGESATAVELVRRADVAMYEAKAKGKNRIEVYAQDLDTARTAKARLALDLREAIRRHALDVHYQPVVDAASGRIVSLEALIRWIRPGHGPTSPAVFLPVAEEVGLIEEIGAFVLRRVCRDAAAWGDIDISVNVSGAQFRNPGFDETVIQILREADFPPSRLVLDITESYLIAFPDRAKRTIERLRELGISVALDDFGTGFSSIGYLRRFAFDRLKIDRSMVLDIVKDPASRKLLQATIALADALGVQVTAEGIEHESEARVLREAGCHELQGFHFGSPTTPQEITRRLKIGEVAEKARLLA